MKTAQSELQTSCNPTSYRPGIGSSSLLGARSLIAYNRYRQRPSRRSDAVRGPILTGGGLLASSLGVPVGVQSHEAELEAEYTAKVYRGVFITPDIQYIINPDGTSRIHTALCVALQINATF